MPKGDLSKAMAHFETRLTPLDAKKGFRRRLFLYYSDTQLDIIVILCYFEMKKGGNYE
jgi:hypothetical protein